MSLSAFIYRSLYTSFCVSHSCNDLQEKYGQIRDWKNFSSIDVLAARFDHLSNICLSVSLSLHHSVPLSLHLSVSQSLSVPLVISRCFSVSLSLYLLFPYAFGLLSLCLPVPFFFSLSPLMFLCRFVNLFFCFSVLLSLCPCILSVLMFLCASIPLFSYISFSQLSVSCVYIPLFLFVSHCVFIFLSLYVLHGPFIHLFFSPTLYLGLSFISSLSLCPSVSPSFCLSIPISVFLSDLTAYKKNKDRFDILKKVRFKKMSSAQELSILWKMVDIEIFSG
mgnify:FL=1